MSEGNGEWQVGSETDLFDDVVSNCLVDIRPSISLRAPPNRVGSSTTKYSVKILLVLLVPQEVLI